MKPSIKLSIIVPVYNVEPYIEQCISSLLVPGCGDYEVIVVNDGTKDRSIEIIRERVRDERIRILEKDNGGLSSARNYGIKEARGEYIWCFDSDDWAETDLIPQVINELGRVDLLYFCSYYKNFDKNHSQLLKTLSNDANTGLELACKGFWHPTQFYIMKKQVLISNNLHYTEGILHEDSLFTPIMIVKCESVKCYKTPVYHHRQRAGSIMNSPVSAKRIYDLIFVITNLLNFGETLPLDVRYCWGRCIAQLINEVLMCAQRCNDKEPIGKVKAFLNRNQDIYNYLVHAGRNNMILAILSKLFWGNLYDTYSFLHRLRYRHPKE